MSTHAAHCLVSTHNPQQKSLKWPFAALVAFAAALVVGGCGSETDPGGGPPLPQTTLECATEGYPCSLSEVPLAILERSDALADSVLVMLDGDASAAAAAAWLETQPGMAEVQSDELAVRFRLDGGRGTWILLEGATAPPAAGSGPSGFATPDIERVEADEARGVIVGEDLENKKALVLSPFLYQFGEFDDGEAVGDILANTRGYKDGVDFLSNGTAAATEVGVESFGGWGQYQVVHVSTHGRRLCDEGGCRGIIAVTTLEAILPGSGQTAAEKTQTLKQQGLAVMKSKLHPNTTFISITADFLRSRYPSGLDNTVVFLNACQSFSPQATDLVEALRGNSSVVFGWDESVYASEAFAAAVALFNELSDGYPAEIAYERLGSLRFGSATPHGPAPTLIVGSRPNGGDLRIREVVTLLEPQTGLELSASSMVPIDGVESDGVDDGAPFSARVEGMTPELAGTAVLHVSVDDVEADPVTVSDGTPDGQDRWTFEGVVPLGYDVTAATGVTYRAWVELPDDGESHHETSATLTGDEPIMGRTWELAAVDSAYYIGLPNTPQISTAHSIILSFEPGQEASAPNPRYIVTGGTVTFNWSHTFYDCTYSGGVTFDVTPEIAGGSHLTFITTRSPAGYWGYVSTVGPTFQAFEQCGEEEGNNRTQGSTNTWMFLSSEADAQEVSADNHTITGEYVRGSGSYVRVSRYTITRLD